MRKKKSQANLNTRAVLWIEHHIESFKLSFSRLKKSPAAFISTTLMIAIALSIPISLYLLFSSVRALTYDWNSDKQITLFLKDNVDFAQAQQLTQSISSMQGIANAMAVNKQTALEEFRQQMDLGSLTKSLPENPLPHLIVVNPESTLTDLQSLITLENDLRGLKQVEQVQFDLIWYQRLQAILAVIHRVQWIISIILLLAIGLIIANVVRWEITGRHAEVEIIKLVGASDAYVRRPFLYSGFWLGFTGAVLSLFVVSLCSWLVHQATSKLAALFGNDFDLSRISFGLASSIIISVSMLGVVSAWIAVAHKLKVYR